MKYLISLILIFTIGFSEELKNKVISLGDAEPQKATIDDVAWIAGNWKGYSDGILIEENWSKPSNGSMMAAYKLSIEDTVKMYELCTISETEGTLVVRVHHHFPDLKSYGEKEPLGLLLVKLEENKAYFDNFTFELVDKNNLNIYVDVGDRVEKFEYSKNND